MLAWSGSASAKSVDIVFLKSELVIEMDKLEGLLFVAVVTMIGWGVGFWLGRFLLSPMLFPVPVRPILNRFIMLI